MACAGLLKLIDQHVILPDETVVVNCSGHTFPVEKHLLDERRVRDLHLEPAGFDPWTGEGVLTALDRLDERVKSIAIVEDDPSAARLLRRILQAKGNYNILEANDGQTGLEVIQREHPDLVLLDLMMPNIDGFDVVDALKADKQLSHIPIIIVTAKELTLAEKNRLSGRVEALLQKGSFMEDDLLEGILEALD
jgi:threonine synthase